MKVETSSDRLWMLLGLAESVIYAETDDERAFALKVFEESQNAPCNYRWEDPQRQHTDGFRRCTLPFGHGGPHRDVGA